MIKNIFIYRSQGVNPYHNIATEKYLLETVPEDTCILYLWQNENTVVIGRNQNAWVECRTSLLEEEGGKLARRLSGGGAVFHDLGNLNFTFLVRDEDYDLDKQLSVIQTACGYVDIDVERSGRNDLLAQGQKFSGNAFYHSQGHAYHHGTLLVNANMEKLGRYLTPSKAKLQAKGVSSVRSRVVNLQNLAPSLTCETLADCMEKAFSEVYGAIAEPLALSAEAEGFIAKYEKELSDWQWLYGPRLPFSFSCDARLDWGSVEIQLQIIGGHIHAVQVFSDSMDWALPDTLKNALTNCQFTKSAMKQAITDCLGNCQTSLDICALLENQDI